MASEDWSSYWSLAPGATYLNHGSFGPAPRPVIEAHHRWFKDLQQNPMEFFVRRLDFLLDEAAERLARFIGCRGKDLIFVPNSTVAMNIVAESVELQPGDEVLLNDHEYGAVMRIWRRKCEAAGAETIISRLPQPMDSPDGIVEALFARVTDRTRLIVISHVTSPTATVLPVEEICRLARARGVPVCVDGPHALAMRPLSLSELGCEFYCASCHKWLSAPFGSGFLYVRGERKSQLNPPILSWGRSLSGRPAHWKDEFHWFGTYQPAAFLSIPAAIEFLERVGLERFREGTHALVRSARERLIEELDGEPLTADDIAWCGSMTTVRLPWVIQRSTHPGIPHPLQRSLAEEFRIEAPIVEWNDAVHIRVSCHLYNTPEHVDRLIDALMALRK